MNAISIIDKKRLKQELSYEEIKFIFEGFLNGEVEDYQMSSLLMAIVLNGMTDNEIFALTDIFINSGDILDFKDIVGIVGGDFINSLNIINFHVIFIPHRTIRRFKIIIISQIISNIAEKIQHSFIRENIVFIKKRQFLTPYLTQKHQRIIKLKIMRNIRISPPFTFTKQIIFF